MLNISTSIKYLLLKDLWFQNNYRHRTLLSKTQFSNTKHIQKTKGEVIYEIS